MQFFRQLNQFMVAGAKAQAQWELEMSTNILKSRKRLLVLGLLLLPAIIGGICFADDIGNAVPNFLGGKSAYGPSHYSTLVFGASILVGLCAGLITGCIGAGGGFIIAPALMSVGVKGILSRWYRPVSHLCQGHHGLGAASQNGQHFRSVWR